MAGTDEHAFLCHAICEAAADFMLRPSEEQPPGPSLASKSTLFPRRREFESDFEKLHLS